MRLKTLHKKRPAFENEGTIINGNRMDISNNESRPPKHRTNNAFALPTSLNNEMLSLNISMSDRTHETDLYHLQQTPSFLKFNHPPPSQATRTSSYQAIEAAYLGHGIRIHLNPATAAAMNQQQNQTAKDLTERQSQYSTRRLKAFHNRNPSRSSSALHYEASVQDPYQDTRPFSALQQASMTDFEPTRTSNISFAQTIENQPKLPSSEQLNDNYCSSSFVVSENFDHMRISKQLAGTNDKALRVTLSDNDPDLIYMGSLFQKANGESFRDTIRRRAGLRPTLAVHRHPQPTTNTQTKSITTTTTTTAAPDPKQHEKSSVIYSSVTNHRNSPLRNSTIRKVPNTTPIQKKVEKDILKHASRIRTSQLKDYFSRQENSIKSRSSEHTVSVVTSPTRTSYLNRRSEMNKPLKSLNLEPLELLLTCASPSSSPSIVSSPSCASPTNNHNKYQVDKKFSKKYTKSPKNSFAENGNNTPNEKPTDFLIEQTNSSSINVENSLLTKISSLGVTNNNRIHQLNSFDSGCYDQCSDSDDTRSTTPLSIHQTSNSVPLVRITSTSTRRLNASKKVSFKDQSNTVTITTATYA